jgi:glycosyltransferase involved in cell wall biosynthesis
MSVFNAQETIDRAIESIVNQSLTDWELIIIDDGSSDRTSPRLEAWKAKDSRIRVVRSTNQGITESLINGCELAQADFIARQDADDSSHPQRLQLQLEKISSDDEIGMVSCFVDYTGPNGEFLFTQHRPLETEEATDRLLNHREGPPAHGSVMFRRSTYMRVGGYRPEFYYAQDADLWLRIAEIASVAYIGQSLYTFARGTESISGKHRNHQKQLGDIGQLCRQARNKGEPETKLIEQAARISATARNEASNSGSRQAKSSVLYLIGSQLLRNGDINSRSYFLDAIREYPLNIRAWARLTQSMVPKKRTHSK